MPEEEDSDSSPILFILIIAIINLVLIGRIVVPIIRKQQDNKSFG